ncbi:outer membrane receptor protein involved in Fe transport [Kordia periserrulae]|uniref:Outer membrane receptor protein involved in Fe transport n=1 Tax=Kordia periserrulae TaxID=701523 RepID=A0A2T6C420_9FLAO|nr:TonB-dependent receptor [Kordia periserrulae]PTX63027.1 outer membrane receptor protein involved in Fe transport [Kordia periserrulae]
MKTKLQAFIVCILLPIIAFAQSITGKITNPYDIPIAEAQIFNQNTKKHTHSDEYGTFLLENVSVGDSLRVSHIGYQTKYIVINSLNEKLSIFLEKKTISLNEVVITPELDALNLMSDINIQINPVNSSQEILQQVPGLFIGQHAGGGKAEQIFLRGFDIDHGTDIAITADGIPVNMVSHAHGQGYADLHFLIPETLDKIDFGKGPYYANQGNFNTAGYVDFKTKKRLKESMIKLEAGQFDTYRMLGMFNILNTSEHSAYIASEYLATDGPFESPQNFYRFNILGKYTGNISENDRVGVTLSHFESTWDASGQIPQRAVDSGLISRFGAIDDTEGGTTSRTNLLINYDKRLSPNASVENSFFYSKYDFTLYSNFTFFLDDPINGDQIKQQENRTLFGFKSEYSRSFRTNSFEGEWNAGISLRKDLSNDNALSKTLNRREILSRTQFGDIDETNVGAFLNASLEFGKWTINPAIRVDYFDFQYNDFLQTQYETQSETKAILSPKLNFLYNHSDNLQAYVKTGKGFHSNDTRVVVTQNGREILPSAYGFDAGFIWKPIPELVLNTAYWQLYLEQEFVYVGDAGIVEPSGKTRRQGIDLSVRYQPFQWLFWNVDTNYTHARSTEAPNGEDFIPLAPDFTVSSSLNFQSKDGFYGGFKLRHIKDRPANEDNSIVAEGYTVVDFNIGYDWKNMSFGLQIQNLFDTEWNETQFATESRLQNETQSVEEIHFTPGVPFFAKASVTYRF